MVVATVLFQRNTIVPAQSKQTSRWPDCIAKAYLPSPIANHRFTDDSILSAARLRDLRAADVSHHMYQMYQMYHSRCITAAADGKAACS